jgi:hypothetical protein
MSEAERNESSLLWCKSSYSVANGACVEAAAVPGAVMVRDTVSPRDGQLRFPVQAWQEFIARVKEA